GDAQPLPRLRRPLHAGAAGSGRGRARARPPPARHPGAPGKGAPLVAGHLRAPDREGRVHGIETVSNMAEEAKDPGHDIPRSVNLVLVAVLGVYAGISVVALSALPVIHHGVGYSPALSESFHHAGYATALGGHFENDPVLGIV